MLSVVASMTPFSDYNQSPRNMYQVRIRSVYYRPLSGLIRIVIFPPSLLVNPDHFFPLLQCQMAKQTMGTPLQALTHRTDTKLYRLQTPQAPIARTNKYNEYHMDEYPNGTNMVVAVLAHTGVRMQGVRREGHALTSPHSSHIEPLKIVHPQKATTWRMP